MAEEGLRRGGLIAGAGSNSASPARDSSVKAAVCANRLDGLMRAQRPDALAADAGAAGACGSRPLVPTPTETPPVPTATPPPTWPLLSTPTPMLPTPGIGSEMPIPTVVQPASPQASATLSSTSLPRLERQAWKDSARIWKAVDFMRATLSHRSACVHWGDAAVVRGPAEPLMQFGPTVQRLWRTASLGHYRLNRRPHRLALNA
jgi:hypothetical protein